MKKRTILGIGGIGKGLFFQSKEDNTLGRNESRMAILQDIKDYCKLHIVFHYVSQFASEKAQVIPVGFIGDDQVGVNLRAMMQRAGMDVSAIHIDNTLPTMISVCLQYPDKSGCNITSANSACNKLDAAVALHALNCYNIGAGDIVVSLPEVSLESRFALLREGKHRNALCVSSMAAAEAEEFHRSGILEYCDFIALNNEETAALADVRGVVDSLDEAEICAQKILYRYPNLKLWLTVGAKGSISADLSQMRRYETFPVTVKNTGGAGDATLGGIIAGLALGMPFHRQEETAKWGVSTIESASELGTLLGTLSVSSEDSIDERLTPSYLDAFLAQQGWRHNLQKYFID